MSRNTQSFVNDSLVSERMSWWVACVEAQRQPINSISFYRKLDETFCVFLFRSILLKVTAGPVLLRPIHQPSTILPAWVWLLKLILLLKNFIELLIPLFFLVLSRCSTDCLGGGKARGAVRMMSITKRYACPLLFHEPVRNLPSPLIRVALRGYGLLRISFTSSPLFSHSSS